MLDDGKTEYDYRGCSLSLKINGQPFRFSGREAVLVDALLKPGPRHTGPRVLSISEAQEETGDPWPMQTVQRINRRLPGFIELSGTPAPAIPKEVRHLLPPRETTWRKWFIPYNKTKMGRPLWTIERLPYTLPAPKKGWLALQDKEGPDLVVVVKGRRRELYTRKAKVLALIYDRGPAFTSVEQILDHIGVDRALKGVANKLIVELRRIHPELFQKGGWGMGWRINPAMHLWIEQRRV